MKILIVNEKLNTQYIKIIFPHEKERNLTINFLDEAINNTKTKKNINLSVHKAVT